MPERDGLLAGIYFLDFMLRTGKTPSQLLDYLYSQVGPHHYQRRDFGFPEEKRQAIIKSVKDNLPQSIDGVRVVKVNDSDGFHLTLADSSWLLIRFSGTEPVLRIYAESDSQARVERLLELGRKLAGV
jgi:phosphomannomutase